MPLLVSDFSWTQTQSTVYINVPLKGAKPAQVDVVCTDEYLKVSFPPFLFEVFLSEPVDEDRSSAKVGNGLAVFALAKKTKTMWDRLMETACDKEKKKQIRDKALMKHDEKLRRETQAKAEKQQRQRKHGLETMMQLEKEERERIQEIKNAERDRTSAELEAWKEKTRVKPEETRVKPQETRVKPEETRVKPEETRVKPQETRVKPQETRVKPEETRVKPQETRVKPEETKSCSDGRKVKVGDAPAPRSPGVIQVSFTPRVFPTALRESRVAEEEQWLRNQAENRRAADPGCEQLDDLEEDEKNPDWLKDKGDKCFAAGNFLAAVNAYNMAARINARIPAVFSNRAACHLKLRNLHKAVEDSSQALQLLTPPVASNAAARLRAHVRRGSAFCRLQLHVQALQDYEAALEIQPENQDLLQDTRRLRELTHTHTHI